MIIFNSDPDGGRSRRGNSCVRRHHPICIRRANLSLSLSLDRSIYMLIIVVRGGGAWQSACASYLRVPVRYAIPRGTPPRVLRTAVNRVYIIPYTRSRETPTTATVVYNTNNKSDETCQQLLLSSSSLFLYKRRRDFNERARFLRDVRAVTRR